MNSQQNNISQVSQSVNKLQNNSFHAPNQNNNVQYQHYKENVQKKSTQDQRMSFNQETSFEYTSFDQKRKQQNPFQTVDNIVKKQCLNNAQKMSEMIDSALEKVQNSIINTYSLNTSNAQINTSNAYLKRRDKSFSNAKGKLPSANDQSFAEKKKVSANKKEPINQRTNNAQSSQMQRVNTVKDLNQQNQSIVQKSQGKIKKSSHKKQADEKQDLDSSKQTFKRSQTPNLNMKFSMRDTKQEKSVSKSQIKRNKNVKQLNSDISSAITSKYSSTQKKEEPKNLRKSKSFLKGQAAQMILKKKEKTPQQKKEFLFHNLGAVIKGYKVRRILKQSKIVKQLRKEYQDMIKFAQSLKDELNEHIRNKSNSIGPIKSLLIQSVKDLNKKKEQFIGQFYEILYSKFWLQQSKQISSIETPQSQRQSHHFLNKTQTYNKDYFCKDFHLLDSIEEEINSRQQVISQQSNLNFSKVKESTSRLSTLKQEKLHIKDEIHKQRFSYIIKKDEQIDNQTLKILKPQQDEIKKYLTQTQEQQQNHQTQREISLKKQFLKKGIQSRKYDPQVAIELEKERKKQQAEKEKEELIKKQKEEAQRALEEKQLFKKVSLGSSQFNLTTRSHSNFDEQTQQSTSLPQNHKQQIMPPILDKKIQSSIFATQSVNEDLRSSSQFLSKIPRLIRKDNLLNSSVSHCQSTKNINQVSSFLSTDTHEQSFNKSRGKITIQSKEKLEIGSKNNMNQTSQKQLELTQNTKYYEKVRTKVQTPQQKNSDQITKSARVSQDLRTSVNFGKMQNQDKQQKRVLNQSCIIEPNGAHVSQLIQELECSSLNKEAKEKTIETLSAITGMLQSLRNNKILASEASIEKREKSKEKGKNVELKNKFESLVKNLQKEFEQLVK